MDFSRTALKVRAQLDGFLGIFSARFSKPMRRFLSQMLFGIQAAQDVKLSRIGRALQESIPLGKTENRLSRNLAHGRLDETLHECVLEHVAPTIGRDTLVIIDPSDIQKDHARKMPCLAKVWDGSKGDVGDNPGYSGCMAVACESGARRMTPLMFRLWSTKAPGFQSENTEVEAVIDAIARSRRGGVRTPPRRARPLREVYRALRALRVFRTFSSSFAPAYGRIFDRRPRRAPPAAKQDDTKGTK